MPLLPLVTSKNDVGCVQMDFADVCVEAFDAKPYAAARIGAEALVPPNTQKQFGCVHVSAGPGEFGIGVLSYTSTPVFGSATAETSASERRMQCTPDLSVCHAGFETNELQPLPVPDHAVSLNFRAFVERINDVPPTQTTVENEHGCCAPVPLSPALAVMM